MMEIGSSTDIPPDEIGDAALVRACRAGDANAWETLVTRYQRLDYSIPRRAGLDGESCNDVFQQVFLILLAELGNIRQPDRLSAWLVTTARRESLRLLRQRTRTTAMSEAADLAASANEPVDSEPLPDQIVERIEQQHQVRHAFDRLDPRCRHLLHLLYVDSTAPSYVQIAADLGVPVGSVGPTRARCIERLRRFLESSQI